LNSRLELTNIADRRCAVSFSYQLRDATRSWLLGRIAAVPELTLEEIRHELHERGITVGYGTVWRFFASEGISFKNVWPAPSARACAI
jgi:transposase